MATAATADSLISVEYKNPTISGTGNQTFETLPAGVYAELTIFKFDFTGWTGWTAGGGSMVITGSTGGNIYTLAIGGTLDSLEYSGMDNFRNDGNSPLVIFMPPNSTFQVLKGVGAASGQTIQYQIKKFAAP